MQGAPTFSLRNLFVCAVLFFGTVALFSRSIGYNFINYDDPAFVVNNIRVQHGLTWGGITWAFALGRDYWHPLTWVSLMVDRELFGADARGYHLVNVLWHAMNALLVFVVGRRMTLGFWASAIGAALFAWHPLRVESVTWITERKDVLSGFFGLLSIWGYLRYADMRARAPGPEMGKARTWYVFTLTAFACGLMSKSVLVTLPLVYLLFDVWPSKCWQIAGDGSHQGSTSSSLLVEKLPFLLLSLAAGLFTVMTQDSSGAFALPLSLDQRVANAVVSIVRYVGLLFWPFGLAVMYPHPGHWPLYLVGGAAAVVGIFTVFALLQYRHRPWVFVGWGWFLLLLLPVLGLIQVGLQAMADRYTYLSIIGLQIALLGAAEAWLAVQPRVPRAAVTGCVALILFGCAARTWDQQAVWRDADTLFAHTLAVTKNNYVADTAIALGLIEQGKLELAVTHAERAVAIAPGSPLAYDGLAVVREAQGRTLDAVDCYRRVLELQPRSIAAKSDLARILVRQGKIEEAEALLNETLELRPEWSPAHLGLAEIALRRERPEEALEHLLEAARLRPRDGDLLLRIAGVQVRLGRKDDAAATLLRAADLAPEDARVQISLGDALGQIGRFTEATVCYETAVKAAPSDAGAHARLGYAKFFQKQPAGAITAWEEALRLDPRLDELHERIRQARQGIEGGK